MKRWLSLTPCISFGMFTESIRHDYLACIIYLSIPITSAASMNGDSSNDIININVRLYVYSY